MPIINFTQHPYIRMNDENNQTLLDAGAALSAARSAGTPGPLDGAPYVVVPEGYKLEVLEKLLPHPTRKKANVVLRDVQSLARYLEQHGGPNTVLFYDGLDNPAMQFTAVLDYHAPNEAAAEGVANWCGHTVRFAPKLSVQWRFWLESSGDWMAQEDFAEKLQDHTEDVQEPKGADLVEIARELIAKKSFDFRSALNLKNGTVQFSYVENMETSGGEKGQIEVPSRFTLAIPLHEAGTRYAVECRLRYKINERRLTFRYDLLKIDDVIRYVNGELVAAVKTVTKLEPFVGGFA